MRSMTSARTPVRRRLMVTATRCGAPAAATSTRSARKVDGVLHQIAEPVEDRRDCARRPARRAVAAAPRRSHAEIAVRRPPLRSAPSSGMRSNGSPEDSSVSLPRMSRQRCACSRSRAHVVGMRRVEARARAPVPWRSRKIVDSGVPSSCAAAAARPSSCERCCSRASTSSVAASASASWRASSVICHA
jgi:hypothetical protein